MDFNNHLQSGWESEGEDDSLYLVRPTRTIAEIREESCSYYGTKNYLVRENEK